MEVGGSLLCFDGSEARGWEQSPYTPERKGTLMTKAKEGTERKGIQEEDVQNEGQQDCGTESSPRRLVSRKLCRWSSFYKGTLTAR